MDDETVILRVDERLLAVQVNENLETKAFIFDDIFMCFRHTLGIRYLSILADLINSKVIKLSDCNIFHKRLITGKDSFDPVLRRLYTDRSHVISMTKLDEVDHSVAYSTNIGRFHMDYSSAEIDNDIRGAAWRMVIDYRSQNFAFIADRMLLFVNGHLIPEGKYEETYPGLIHLLDFDEIISCVDVLYSKHDLWLARVKRICMEFWKGYDNSSLIQHPDRDYTVMNPIGYTDLTLRGYYDVLLKEYVLNGRLQRLARYYNEHPDEFDHFRKELVNRFHAISDIDLANQQDGNARIIIPCLTVDGIAAYDIKAEGGA